MGFFGGLMSFSLCGQSTGCIVEEEGIEAVGHDLIEILVYT